MSIQAIRAYGMGAKATQKGLLGSIRGYWTLFGIILGRLGSPCLGFKSFYDISGLFLNCSGTGPYILDQVAERVPS